MIIIVRVIVAFDFNPLYHVLNRGHNASKQNQTSVLPHEVRSGQEDARPGKSQADELVAPRDRTAGEGAHCRPLKPPLVTRRPSRFGGGEAGAIPAFEQWKPKHPFFKTSSRQQIYSSFRLILSTCTSLQTTYCRKGAWRQEKERCTRGHLVIR